MTKFTILVIFSLIFVLHVLCEFELAAKDGNCYVVRDKIFYRLDVAFPSECGNPPDCDKRREAIQNAITFLGGYIDGEQFNFASLAQETDQSVEYIGVVYVVPDQKIDFRPNLSNNCCKEEFKKPAIQKSWLFRKDKVKGPGDATDNSSLQQVDGNGNGEIHLESLIEKLIEDLK
eukprot:c18774_g2_i2.p1 GENE.c18774_g2_i2~~c18774_g2_i2.p1  ORF type:complete len:186 (+),score=13.40 c18774_g2_i2:35-559(+)